METLLFIIVSAIGSTLFRRFVEPHLLETVDFIIKPTDPRKVEPSQAEEVFNFDSDFKYRRINGYITIDCARTKWSYGDDLRDGVN